MFHFFFRQIGSQSKHAFSQQFSYILNVINLRLIAKKKCNRKKKYISNGTLFLCRYLRYELNFANGNLFVAINAEKESEEKNGTFQLMESNQIER